MRALSPGSCLSRCSSGEGTALKFPPLKNLYVRLEMPIASILAPIMRQGIWNPAVIPSCVRCTKRPQSSRVHIVSCVLPRVFDLGKTVSPQELKLPYHHYQSQTYMHNPCSSCFSFCSSAVAVVSAFGDDRRSSGRVSVVLDLRCDLRGGAGGAGTFGCPGGG